MSRRSDDGAGRRPDAKGPAPAEGARGGRNVRLRRAGWFVLLWCFGVAATALLALPFHWLVVSAIRHPG